MERGDKKQACLLTKAATGTFFVKISKPRFMDYMQHKSKKCITCIAYLNTVRYFNQQCSWVCWLLGYFIEFRIRDLGFIYL